MEENKRTGFMEGILSRVANTLAKYQTYEPPPKTDSSIETRKKEIPAGSGSAAAAMNVGAWYDEQMHIDQARVSKYNDYDMMDIEDPELASALDIYADNATKYIRS